MKFRAGPGALATGEVGLGSRGARSVLFGAVWLASTLLYSNPAFAQSAADKATARELAVQGIKQFDGGDAEGALKKLEKAQALYDAPVHLLYIGRAHAKLGQLVEAAEAYRTLVRARLDSDAPAAFRKAQEDGQEELNELEPRLAKLTIEVEPQVEGLEVTVDDRPINTAALSVPRATNPGRRLVRATAPGYLPAESEIALVEGGSDTVRLALEVDPDAPEEVTNPGGGTGAGTSGLSNTTQSEESGPFGFILGLRGAGVLSVGALTKGEAALDYFQPGGAGRAEVGFRFLRYVGIKGYFGMGGLSPGSELNRFAEAQESGIVANNKGSFTDAGVLLMGTTDPRVLGGFGELGLSFIHKYQWEQKFAGEGVNCTMGADYSGWGLRAGGGMNIPANRILNFVPAVDVTLGQFTTVDTKNDCQEPAGGNLGVDGASTRFQDPGETALHFQIFLGFGADLHFGDGLFQ